MSRWPRPLIAMAAFVLKAGWAIVVVTWLAAAEPFWHQAVLVLGGATITAGAIIIGSLIGSRRVERPIEEVRKDLAEHRSAIEDPPRDPESRTRVGDEPDSS